MQCTTLPSVTCTVSAQLCYRPGQVSRLSGPRIICSRPITCRYCASLYNQYINPIQTVLPVAWLPSNTGTLFNLTHDAMVLYCTVPSYLWPYGTVLYSTQFLMTYSVVPDTRSCGRLYVKSRCGRRIIFSWTLATNDWRLVIILCRNDNKRPSEQKPRDI